MENIATFEKVSFEQYLKDRERIDNPDVADEEWVSKMRDEYELIKLPYRATEGSAGYDFYAPADVVINESPVTIPTGIRCKIDHGMFLGIVPRSSLGFKYGMRLQNTLGIIDEDYAFADNEGHIMVRLTSQDAFKLKAGDRFVQGIFFPYGTATNGNGDSKRTGGMGSTGTN